MSILQKKRQRRQRGKRNVKAKSKMAAQINRLATAEKAHARAAANNLGRDQISKERTSISWAKAPEHPDLGPGDRVTIHCTPYVVGRTGDTYNSPLELLKFTFGTTSSYGKSIAFGPVWAANSASGAANALCAYGSAYTTNGASAINRATAQLQFYNSGAVRSVKVSYSPTCNAITTTGNLAIAPLFTDSGFGYSGGAHLDMKTYSDVASMPGSFRTPVVRSGSFYLKKMTKPDLPSSEFFAMDSTGSFATLRMLIACDTQLGAGAADNLGELSFEIVLDMYGPQWNPPLPLSATSQSPDERMTLEQQKVVDAVCARFGKVKLEPPSATTVPQSVSRAIETLEGKEVKTTALSRSEEMAEWEKIEIAEAQKRIADQKAYRAAVSAAIRSDSTSSTTTQPATAVASPNVVGRLKQ